MILDKELFDNLTAQAKGSERLRMNFDLRDSSEDGSQRMLNALEPGTVLPIHRHRTTSETVVILRGRAVQYLYDEDGNVTEKVLLAAGAGDEKVKSESGLPEESVAAMQVNPGQWHRIESLESGTVIVEFKNGPFAPLSEADIF